MRSGPTWLTVAFGAAAGFLAGVLLIVGLAVGRGGEAPSSTVAERPPEQVEDAPPRSEDRRISVPAVTGMPLNLAREKVEFSGFEVDVDGGGFFGVVLEENWLVTEQHPAPGDWADPGSTVVLTVARTG